MDRKIDSFTKWDTHHHINPDFYEKACKEAGYEKVNGLSHPKWSVNKMLGWMEKINMRKVVMSISTPGVYFGDNVKSSMLCRQINNYMSGLIKEYPEKLGGFGVVPLPDVEKAVLELKYAIDELHMDGLGILSNLGGYYLGDPSFAPFFEEANKRKVVIYIHPTSPIDAEQYMLLNYTYMFRMDTTRTIVDFLRSGYHKKYPDIRFVLSHGGGVLPAVIETVISDLSIENPHIQMEFDSWRHQLFADTSLIAYPEDALPQALEFFGSNHLVFGSDLCWAPTKYKYFVKEFMKADLSEQQFENIFINNAKRIFRSEKVSFNPIKTGNGFKTTDFERKSIHLHGNPIEVIEAYGKRADDNEKVQMTQWDFNELKEQLKKNGKSIGYLVMDDNPIWEMSQPDIWSIIRCFNDNVETMKANAPKQFRSCGIIDSEDSDRAIEEIDYCVHNIRVDAICLYVNIYGKAFESMFNEQLLIKLQSLRIPILVHPKKTKGIVTLAPNKIDAVTYLYSLLYMDYYDHLLSTNYVLTHAERINKFITHAVGTMLYIDPKTQKTRTAKALWEMIIQKKDYGHDCLSKFECIQ